MSPKPSMASATALIKSEQPTAAAAGKNGTSLHRKSDLLGACPRMES